MLSRAEDKGIQVYESNREKLGQEPTPPPNPPTPVKPQEYKCKFLTDLNFYDLRPLSKLGPFTLNGINPNYNLSFSLCNDLDVGLRCNPDEPVMAVSRSINSFDHVEECFKLSGTGRSNIVDHFILDKDNNDGIKIHLGGSNEQCDDWRNYDLTIDISCNSSISTLENMNFNITEDNHCFKVIKF